MQGEGPSIPHGSADGEHTLFLTTLPERGGGCLDFCPDMRGSKGLSSKPLYPHSSKCLANARRALGVGAAGEHGRRAVGAMVSLGIYTFGINDLVYGRAGAWYIENVSS